MAFITGVYPQVTPVVLGDDGEPWALRRGILLHQREHAELAAGIIKKEYPSAGAYTYVSPDQVNRASVGFGEPRRSSKKLQRVCFWGVPENSFCQG